MDKVAELSKNLKNMKEKFDALKKSGVNEELLIVWIMHATKYSKKDVKAMLDAQEEFFDKLIQKEVADKL